MPYLSKNSQCDEKTLSFFLPNGNWCRKPVMYQLHPFRDGTLRGKWANICRPLYVRSTSWLESKLGSWHMTNYFLTSQGCGLWCTVEMIGVFNRYHEYVAGSTFKWRHCTGHCLVDRTRMGTNYTFLRPRTAKTTNLHLQTRWTLPERDKTRSCGGQYCKNTIVYTIIME